MKSFIPLFLFTMSSISLKAQFQQSGVLNDKDFWGAPAFKYANRLNGLYAATSNWTVTSTLTSDLNYLSYLFDDDLDNSVSIPTNSTHTFTIDYAAKHATGYSSSIVYGGGTVLLHFYYQNIPTSVEVKVFYHSGNLPQGSITSQVITMQNISVSAASGLAVYSGYFPGLLYLTSIEVKVINSSTSQTANLTEIQYVVDRPISQQLDNAFITNYRPQSIYQPFSWRDNNNNIVARINTDGTSYFTEGMGIGTNSPGCKLHVAEGNIASSFNSLNGFVQLWGDNALIWKNGNANHGLRFGSATSLTADNYSQKMILTDDGRLGIGTPDPGVYRLAVNGDIAAKKIKVTQSGWPDYVFDPSYKLLSLESTEAFINQHKHLPEVPSANQVIEDGIDLGDNQAALLKKIEELTLYVIQLNKTVKEQVVLLQKYRAEKLKIKK